LRFNTLAGEIRLLSNSTSYDAKIVEVRHEYVPQGKGSILAYVPVVQANGVHSLKVDTYSEENIYVVGRTMEVMCDFSVSQRCIENTFFGKWGDFLITFSFSLLFLIPSLLHFRRLKQSDPNAAILKVLTR